VSVVVRLILTTSDLESKSTTLYPLVQMS